MKINSSYTSPNFTSLEIPVDFVVLHYTACSLQRTLEIFNDRERKVCAHFVVDTDGCVYDLGGFYQGPILCGAHAGKSHLEISGTKYINFNQFSIGIEIINLNGNLIEYTEEQYASLAELVHHLQKRFPVLKNPDRIVGHEHIAHWRGKADPGVLFNWTRFLASLGLKPSKVHSFFACGSEDLEWLKSQEKLENWSKLSHQLETRIAQKMST
jgi:N-acetylmuramoyl-L-alanine amidase